MFGYFWVEKTSKSQRPKTLPRRIWATLADCSMKVKRLSVTAEPRLSTCYPSGLRFFKNSKDLRPAWCFQQSSSGKKMKLILSNKSTIAWKAEKFCKAHQLSSIYIPELRSSTILLSRSPKKIASFHMAREHHVPNRIPTPILAPSASTTSSSRTLWKSKLSIWRPLMYFFVQLCRRPSTQRKTSQCWRHWSRYGEKGAIEGTWTWRMRNPSIGFRDWRWNTGGIHGPESHLQMV